MYVLIFRARSCFRKLRTRGRIWFRIHKLEQRYLPYAVVFTLGGNLTEKDKRIADRLERHLLRLEMTRYKRD